LAEVSGSTEEANELHLIKFILPDVVVEAEDYHDQGDNEVKHRANQQIAQIPETPTTYKPEEEGCCKEESPYFTSL
jgi:hypothetical protein